jgi:hypothetical protein
MQARVKSLIPIVLLVLSNLFVLGQHVKINEVCPAGTDKHKDIYGDNSDWIELYNSGSEDINLSGYGLSDKELNLRKWIFPDLIIPAKSYKLVFASNKNIVINDELHTNFKISKEHEELFLTNEKGVIIDYILVENIPENYSLARINKEENNFYITNNATPNADNNSSNGLFWSHSSGYYDEGILLKLHVADSLCKIYYTLNGNTPTSSDLPYTEPIPLGPEPNSKPIYSFIPTTPLQGEPQLNDFKWKVPKEVNQIHTIRFACVKKGEIQDQIQTNAYIIGVRHKYRYTFPVVSLVIDSMHLFDYEQGIYIPGKRFDEKGFNWWPEGNYHNNGDEWERQASIQYFNKNGNLAFESIVGIRMRGYGSASYPQKSFNVFFRSEYGQPNINYPIFQNFGNRKFKRIIFRNGGNDFLKSHFKDAMLQFLFSEMDLELQDIKPAILFINGEYWGIHNIREKYDKYYFKYKFGIHEDSVNLLSICGQLEEGSNKDYIELLDFMEQNPMVDDENYEYVLTQIDIDNFIDFLQVEIFTANYDWPCNNFKIWKPETPDAKWRFLIYDLDYSFGYDFNSDYNAQSMIHATQTGSSWPYCDCSNYLFRNLLTNDKFKERFINRFAEHLNNTFSLSKMNSAINYFESLYAPEIKEHIDRWNYPATVNIWHNEIQKLRDFAKYRPCAMVMDIVHYFNLSSFNFECISDSALQQFDKPLHLYPNPSKGSFSIFNTIDSDIDDAILTIHNSFGVEVFRQTQISITSQQSFPVFLTHLKDGVYIASLLFNNQVFRKPIVIVNS